MWTQHCKQNKNNVSRYDEVQGRDGRVQKNTVLPE